jgi:hypothetical protein
MFKKLQERIFPFIIALSALSVSASAAFYSVTGLSKLFAGASTEVFIMAGSLRNFEACNSFFTLPILGYN